MYELRNIGQLCKIVRPCGMLIGYFSEGAVQWPAEYKGTGEEGRAQPRVSRITPADFYAFSLVYTAVTYRARQIIARGVRVISPREEA